MIEQIMAKWRARNPVRSRPAKLRTGTREVQQRPPAAKPATPPPPQPAAHPPSHPPAPERIRASQRARERAAMTARSICELRAMRSQALSALAEIPDPVPKNTPYRRLLGRNRRELLLDVQAIDKALHDRINPEASLSESHTGGALVAAQRRAASGNVGSSPLVTSSPYAADSAIEESWRSDR